ncbi:MAG TPA: GNAT family N-acetyltransferase [Solirubrobacteraceae bacterium]
MPSSLPEGRQISGSHQPAHSSQSGRQSADHTGGESECRAFRQRRLLRWLLAKLEQIAQPTLYTERLRLVPLADEHLQFEIELDSDPEVMRYITGRALSPGEVERAHRRRLAAADGAPGLGFWAGFADDEFVGWWILQPPNGPDQPRVAGEADLGFRLLRRHWRRSYASEGARELIRYGFEEVRLDRIFAQTMAVNAASRATMAAVGLTFARAFVSGEPYDDLVPGAKQGEVEYEITGTTWQRRSERHRSKRRT